MKKLSIILCTVFIVMSSLITPDRFKSGITGTVEPPEGAMKIWAISGTDSIATVTSSGKFSLELKPGSWKVVVQAAKPYKNYSIENIVVLENQFSDTGVIKLEKE